jgi:hypothetical protein
MKEFKHEIIQGAKVYFGKGITEEEKTEIRKFVEVRPDIYRIGDVHFWKSDNKIMFQCLIGKEYFGHTYEINLINKKLKAII